MSLSRVRSVLHLPLDQERFFWVAALTQVTQIDEGT
jgi:hypothetical protein